ncbi:MAG: CHAT domain-containing protein [Parasphingorhabdus sp.]
MERSARRQLSLAHYRLGDFRDSANITKGLFDFANDNTDSVASEKNSALSSYVIDLVRIGKVGEAQNILDPALKFEGLDPERDRWVIGSLHEADAIVKEAKLDYTGAYQAYEKAFTIFSEERYRFPGSKESWPPPNFESQSSIHTALDMEALEHRNFREGFGFWSGKWIKVEVNGDEILKTDQSLETPIEISDRVSAKLMKNAAMHKSAISFQKIKHVMPLYLPYLEWLEGSVGKNSVSYAAALMDLADVQMSGYIYAGAEQSAREALRLQSSKLDTNHPSILRAKIIIGQSLSKQRLNDQAKETLQSALSSAETNLQSNIENFMNANLELDRILRRQNKSNERLVLWGNAEAQISKITIPPSVYPLEKLALMMSKIVRVGAQSDQCVDQNMFASLGMMQENLKLKPGDGARPFLPSYFQTASGFLDQARIEITACSDDFDKFHQFMDSFAGTNNAYPLGSNESRDDLVEKIDRWIELTMRDPEVMRQSNLRARVFDWLGPIERIALSQINLTRRVGTDIDSQRSRILSEHGDGLAYRYVLDRRLKLNWAFKNEMESKSEEDSITTFGFSQPRSPNAFSEAFIAAQYLRMDKSSQTMSKAVARAAAPNPKLAALAKRYQQLSETIYGQIRNGRNDGKLEAQEEFLRIDSALQKQFPDYYALAAPKPLELSDAWGALEDKEGLLMITPSGGDLYVFGISNKFGVDERYSAWHRIENGEQVVSELVKSLRCEIDPEECGEQSSGTNRSGNSNRGKADGWIGFSFNRNAAYELYRLIIEPISGIFEKDQSYEEQTQKLYVVTSGAISALPLSLLLTDKPTDDGFDAADDVFLKAPWLSRRFEISYLPSVSDLNLKKKVEPKTYKITGYGDPEIGKKTGTQNTKRGSQIFNERTTRGGELVNVDAIRQMAALPGTAAELAALQNLFAPDQSRIFMQSGATETKLKNDALLVDSDVVIFSTHGVLPDPENGFAEPGLIFTPPDKGSASDDGFLSASEAAAVPNSANLVVLSACNTASAGDLKGADSLAGLARSFLYSGAQSIYASHWRVDDTITKELIVLAVKYARDDPSLTRSKALAMAMEAIRTGKEKNGNDIENWNPDWSHPASWAPFVAISGYEESGS